MTFSGPVFGSWDEAMAHMAEHPDDLSKPWGVAPDADLSPGVERMPPPDEPYEWPSGWTELGATEDGAGTVFWRPKPPDV